MDASRRGKSRPLKCPAWVSLSQISKTSFTFMCRRPHSRRMSLAVPICVLHQFTIRRSSWLKTLRFDHHGLTRFLHAAFTNDPINFREERRRRDDWLEIVQDESEPFAFNLII